MATVLPNLRLDCSSPIRCRIVRAIESIYCIDDCNRILEEISLNNFIYESPLANGRDDKERNLKR